TRSRTPGWASSTWSAIRSWVSRRWARRPTCRMGKTRRCGGCWSWGARRRSDRPSPRSGARVPRCSLTGLRFCGRRVGRTLPQGPAVGDATLAEVVGRDCHGDDVAGQDADEVLADLAGDDGNDLVAAVKPHPELRVGKGLNDLALNLDCFFF